MASFNIPQIVKEKIPRSYFNFSCARRTPATIGVAMPVYHRMVLPGDYFDIRKVAAKIRTLPFINPLMGSFRIQLDWFFEPMTNLYGFMDNNNTLDTQTILDQTLLSTGVFNSAHARVSGAKTWLETPDNFTTNFGLGYVPDCSLMNYLGFPAGFDARNSNFPYDTSDSSVHSARFNLTSFFSYIDIYRTYYTNKQMKYGLFYLPTNTTGTQLSAKYYIKVEQSVLDGMFMDLRMLDSNSRYFSSVNTTGTSLTKFLMLYKPLFTGAITNNRLQNSTVFMDSFTGLGLVNYRPDLYRSIMLPSSAPVTSSVTIANGAFTIDTLRIASHYQKLLDLYDASGGQFSNFIDFQWDVDISDGLDRPVLLGTSHQYINVDDVYSTSLTQVYDQPNENYVIGSYVGEQSGTINTGAGFRGIKFRSKYHGYLFAIVTIVPEVDYSENLDFNLLDTKFSDFYVPAMAQLGYEPMQYSDFAVSRAFSSITPPQYNDATMTNFFSTADTNSQYNVACGRSVHWFRYMSDVNRNYGAFSVGRSLEHWCLNRNFVRAVNGSATNATIDVSTYIIPSDWNYMFAYTAPQAQNWYLQFAFDIQVERALPKFVQGKIV